MVSWILECLRTGLVKMPPLFVTELRHSLAEVKVVSDSCQYYIHSLCHHLLLYSPQLSANGKEVFYYFNTCMEWKTLNIPRPCFVLIFNSLSLGLQTYLKTVNGVHYWICVCGIEETSQNSNSNGPFHGHCKKKKRCACAVADCWVAEEPLVITDTQLVWTAVCVAGIKQNIMERLNVFCYSFHLGALPTNSCLPKAHSTLYQSAACSVLAEGHANEFPLTRMTVLQENSCRESNAALAGKRQI